MAKRTPFLFNLTSLVLSSLLLLKPAKDVGQTNRLQTKSTNEYMYIHSYIHSFEVLCMYIHLNATYIHFNDVRRLLVAVSGRTDATPSFCSQTSSSSIPFWRLVPPALHRMLFHGIRRVPGFCGRLIVLTLANDKAILNL